MTSIKVTIPSVTASGQREGWWYHVTMLAEGRRRPKFTWFVGERLVAGECELPPMAVVMLVRPVGSIRLGARVADIMYVGPPSGQLVGHAYGLPWEAGDACEKLRLAVHTALHVQERYAEANRKIAEAVNSMVNKPCAEAAEMSPPELEIASYVQAVIPGATDITVTPTPSPEAPNGLTVSFALRASGKEGGGE